MFLAGDFTRTQRRIWGRAIALLLPLVVSSRAMAQPSAACEASPASPSVALQGSMLSRSVQLQMEVEHANTARLAIRQLVHRLGATVVEEQDLLIRARVPVEHWEQALSEVSRVGVELSRSARSTERADEMVQLDSEMRALERSKACLVSIRSRVRNTKDGLALEREVQRLVATMEQQSARMNSLRQQVERGELTVSLKLRREPVKEEILSFSLPFEWLERLGGERLKNLQVQGRGGSEGASKLTQHLEMSARVTATRVGDSQKTGDTRAWTLAGLRFRGFTSDHLALGLDLGLGAGTGGGLAYDTRLLGGVGGGLGSRVGLSLMTGVGTSGVTGGRIAGGLEVPVELSASVYLAEALYASLWARPAFVFAAQEKKDGAKRSPFGDTMQVGGKVLMGRESGWVVGGAWEQLMGTGGFSVTVGYGAVLADRRW